MVVYGAASAALAYLIKPIIDEVPGYTDAFNGPMGETIRNALAQLNVRWKRAKHWITSPDPAYARKKSHATD